MATIFRAPIVTRPGVIPPGRSVLDSQRSVSQDLLLTTLKGQDLFFGAAGQVPAYDCQNPRLPIATHRGFTSGVNLNLIGADLFFGLAGHPTFDFPNPRGPQFPVALRSADSNLLETTLAIVTTAPFYQLDWPMPRRKVMPTGLRQTTAFVVSTDAPFTMTDWPVPRGAKGDIGLRTWADPLKINLLGQDQFFAAPGMGPTYDYPNPRGKPYPTSLRHWDSNQIFTTLQLLNPVPYNQYDWPVPKGAMPSTSLKTWTDPLKLELLGQDQFFTTAGRGPTYDWPNPTLAKRVQIAPAWNAPNVLIVGTPFAMRDWPVPKAMQGSISLRTWTWGQSIIGTITPSEMPGVADVDERLPIRRSTDNRLSIKRSTDNRLDI